MTTVTVHEAKTHLSRLIARALDGEEIIIANRDKPKVRIVPVESRAKRQFGSLKGKISLDESFFDPLPEDELSLWEGG